MFYPGDVVTFHLNLNRADGTAATVTAAPLITVLNSSGSAWVTGQAMTLIAGTNKIYKYSWSSPTSLASGKYFAIADYVVDGITFSSNPIGTADIGDSRILGTVALDSTVAKDATVAKDVSVAKASDISHLSPDNSPIIQAIKIKTDALPTSPASEATLQATKDLTQQAVDSMLCHVAIDKTVNPNTLILRRLSDNSIIATFNLSDDSSNTIRTRIS